MKDHLTDDLKKQLKVVFDHFDKEDRATRERQILIWRKLKLYWEGLNSYYSEVAHDWRVIDQQTATQSPDSAYYDKPVNIFRAYLESIIAALSVVVPPVVCAPDDADNPLDIATAKAGNKIAELIFKHNDAPLLWLHALFLLYTEGMVACYSYPKEDEEYGTYEDKEYQDETIEQRVCPNCGVNLADELFTANVLDQFMPEESSVDIQGFIKEEGPICPECGMLLDPQLQKTPMIITRLVGVTKKAKSRQCIEMYGGLYVKIPNYAMRQADMPYLIFSYDTHYTNAIERYPEIRDKISGSQGRGTSATGIYDPYERWGRLSPQYNGEYPSNTVTVRNAWFRCSAFNVLDEDESDELKKLFPNGAKIVVVDDQVVDAENEALDDCWTITHDPLSDFLHHYPLGLALTPIQDITNDLVSLTLQTIEHGIPQTFADPGIVDFDAYRQTEVLPGGMYPTLPLAGRAVSDAFHEVKTANLSGEVIPFTRAVQEMGQLVSGALPSLFGGAQTGGSKTAAEYGMSRAQALQRLQTHWKMLTMWWKNIFGKVIPSYIKNVVEDEKYVSRDESGNYVNVYIRKAELEGKIGSVELESSEQLPITWAQKKDTIMEFLQAGNPIMMQAFTTPENLPFLKEALGMTGFVIPGEDDRNKQLDEIKELLNSEPIVIPPDPMMMQQAMMMGMEPPQPQELPSVEVDPLLDNHQIEFQMCRNWLIGDSGRQAKQENPAGHRNVMLHAKMHMEVMAQNMTQQAAPQPAAQPEGEPTNAE